MAKFMVLSSLKGPIPANFTELPPRPADFGLPTDDDGARDDPLLGANNGTTSYEHDFGTLRAASTRIVIGAGAESEGEMTHRAALAVAERLGTEPVIFPSHHGGFLGGEFGWRGEPDAFAASLRTSSTGDERRTAARADAAGPTSRCERSWRRLDSKRVMCTGAGQPGVPADAPRATCQR